VIRIAALGFHAPCLPISGELQNAPGHQRMSLSSKYDAEKYRGARKIALRNLPFWMAILNL
jgi:hypothetical protein